MLEQPQFPDFGQAQIAKFMEAATWLDAELQRQPFVAGQRFTIADITGMVAASFMKPAKLTIPDEFTNVIRWRDAVSARPSAAA